MRFACISARRIAGLRPSHRQAPDIWLLNSSDDTGKPRCRNLFVRDLYLASDA